jgi:hypothetical protein
MKEEHHMAEKMNGQRKGLGRLRIGVAAGTIAATALLGTGVAFATGQTDQSGTTSTSSATEVQAPEGANTSVDPAGGPNDQVGTNVQDTSGTDVSGTSATSDGVDPAESGGSTASDPIGGVQQQDGLNYGSTGAEGN